MQQAPISGYFPTLVGNSLLRRSWWITPMVFSIPRGKSHLDLVNPLRSVRFPNGAPTLLPDFFLIGLSAQRRSFHRILPLSCIMKTLSLYRDAMHITTL